MADTNGRTAMGAERNGRGRDDGKIRVAIIGVGNCASSLVQGRYYYEDAEPGDFIPGIMHADLGGYAIRDIEFVAAFDVDRRKVGKDLGEAIYEKPNNTYRFHKVGELGVPVERGMTHDGLGILVVVAALHQARGAVPHADDRDPDLAVAAPAAVPLRARRGPAVRVSHPADSRLR